MIGCALFFFLIGGCALFLSVHIVFSLFVLGLDFFFLTKCLNVNVQRVVLPLCNFITHFLYLLLWQTVLRNFNGISYGVG